MNPNPPLIVHVTVAPGTPEYRLYAQRLESCARFQHCNGVTVLIVGRRENSGGTVTFTLEPTDGN